MKRSALVLFMLLGMSIVSLAIAVEKPQAEKPKVAMAEARHTALAKHPGKVEGAELETEDGRLVYSFDIKTKTELREVQVDAYSGEIVSDKVETPEDEAKEKTEEKAKKKAQRSATKK